LIARLSCWKYEGNPQQQSEDDRIDYVCSILTDLISRGLVRGEINYDQGQVELSKDNSFPTLRSAQPKSYKSSKW